MHATISLSSYYPVELSIVKKSGAKFVQWLGRLRALYVQINQKCMWLTKILKICKV